MAERKPTNNQLSRDLPGPTAYLTGHDQNTGKAIVHARRPVNWQNYDSDKLAMSVAYTTTFPADLNNDADVSTHEDKMKTGKLGLVSGGGTVLRYVDFAPGYTCMMHRTQSVDYGIVLEGQIESVLDSGEVQLMGRGDVMVQRATMHAWRNPSDKEWARMIFCLQDCQPLYVKGERFGEDLGRGTVSVSWSCCVKEFSRTLGLLADLLLAVAGRRAPEWERRVDSCRTPRISWAASQKLIALQQILEYYRPRKGFTPRYSGLPASASTSACTASSTMIRDSRASLYPQRGTAHRNMKQVDMHALSAQCSVFTRHDRRFTGSYESGLESF